MGAIKANVSGMSAVQKKLRQATRETVPDAAGAGIYGASAAMMKTAKELTPRLTGAAANSGYTTLPVKRSGGPAVESGFGGAARAYIVSLHERTEVGHPTGQAKFFETARARHVGGMLGDIAKAGRAALDAERSAKQDPSIPVDPFRGAG
jgi:hypothetical protein